MAKKLKTWEAPKLKTLDVEKTLSGPLHLRKEIELFCFGIGGPQGS